MPSPLSFTPRILVLQLICLLELSGSAFERRLRTLRLERERYVAALAIFIVRQSVRGLLCGQTLAAISSDARNSLIWLIALPPFKRSALRHVFGCLPGDAA